MSKVTDGWEKVAQADEATRRTAISPWELAGQYDASGVETAQVLVEMHARYRPGEQIADTRWLDFGCGDGRIAEPLSHWVRSVHAVDAAPSMVAALEGRQLANVTTKVYRSRPLGVKVDHAFAVTVLLHNPYTSGAAILRHVAEALEPGGLCIFDVPIYDVSHPPSPVVGDVGTWTPDMFHSATAAAGLRPLEVWANPGAYRPGYPAENHGRLHVTERH